MKRRKHLEGYGQTSKVKEKTENVTTTQV